MDLLGSILGGMDSLPQKKTDEETKKRVQGNLIIRHLKGLREINYRYWQEIKKMRSKYSAQS